MKAARIIAALLLLCGMGSASDIYFDQSSAGSNNGSSCANARAYSSHAIGDDVAGNTIHLCGTGTVPNGATVFSSLAAGTSGSHITLQFETGTLQADYFNSTNPAIVITHAYWDIKSAQTPATITSWAISANVLTVQAPNSFVSGQLVEINLPTRGINDAHGVYLNGQVLTVLASGLSGTQFKANFTHADDSATETGFVMPINILANLAGTQGATCVGGTCVTGSARNGGGIKTTGDHDTVTNVTTSHLYVHQTFVAPAVTQASESGTTVTLNFSSSLSAGFINATTSCGNDSFGAALCGITVLQVGTGYNTTGPNTATHCWNVASASGTSLTYTAATSGLATINNPSAIVTSCDQNGSAVFTPSFGIHALGTNNRVSYSMTDNSYDGIGGGDGSLNLQLDHNTILSPTHGITVGASNAGNNLTGILLHDNDICCGSNWHEPSANYHLDPFITAIGNVSGTTTWQGVIYNNFVHGAWNLVIPNNISPSPTSWIFLQCPTSIAADTYNGTGIVNNVLESDTSSDGVNGTNTGMISITGGTNCAKNTLIANNSVVSNTSTPVAGVGLRLQDGSSTAQMLNNLLSTKAGTSIQSSAANYPAANINYNVYAGAALTSAFSVWNGNINSFSRWSTSPYGFDANGSNPSNSSTSVLNLDSFYFPTVTSTSLVGTGKNLSSLATGALSVLKQDAPQYFGVLGSCGNGCGVRPAVAAWTVGAYTFGAPVSPSVVTGHCLGLGASTPSGFGVTDGSTAITMTCNAGAATCVSGTPDGTGSGCQQNYANSTSLTVTATAASGSSLTGLVSSGGGCSGTSPCTTNTRSGNIDVSGTFGLVPTATITSDISICNPIQGCNPTLTLNVSNNVGGPWSLVSSSGTTLTSGTGNVTNGTYQDTTVDLSQAGVTYTLSAGTAPSAVSASVTVSLAGSRCAGRCP